MAYGVTYRHRFTNEEGFDVVTLIHDETTAGAPSYDVQIFDLTPSGNPLVLSVIDTDEDKFTPIRAKQLKISFLSTRDYNMSIFVDGSEDNRWSVECYMEDPFIPVFVGFLSLADISEYYADLYNSNEVVLTAVDGLGLLKDLPLTKPDGTVPKGKFTIIQWISWCLLKTGLSLPINVMNNLMEESYPNQPAYNHIYIDSKTFEGDEIGKLLSAYEILQKILGEECFLTQWKFTWWIRRINEYDWNPKYYDSYTETGDYTMSYDNILFEKTIGQFEPIYPIQPWGSVNVDAPRVNIKESYNYEYPKELVDNMDFSRGDIYAPISVPGGIAYHLEDWDVKAGTFTSNVTPNVNAYIARKFTDGIETERYVQITQPTTSLKQWIQSQGVPVHHMDKFSFSADFRTGAVGQTLGGNHVPQLILVANSGTIYTLVGNPVAIVLGHGSPFSWAVFSGQEGIGFDTTSIDGWATVETSERVPPIPADGYLYLCLPAHPSDYIDWANLRFEYQPYINGSYINYTGQYHKVSQAKTLKSVREKDVYISDSPKRLFKGALQKTATYGYQLTGNWYDGSVPANRPTPGGDQLHPLGFIQAYEIWNQYRTANRLLDGTFRGIDSGAELPDLMHTYFFLDHSLHTYMKDFMLVHFEMNLKSCQWSGYFAEVFNRATGRDYLDTHEFKYTESK